MASVEEQGGSSRTYIKGMRWTFAYDGSFLLVYRPIVLGELMPWQNLRLVVPPRLMTVLQTARLLALDLTKGQAVLKDDSVLSGSIQSTKEFVSLNYWPWGDIAYGDEDLELTVEARYTPAGPDPSMHWTKSGAGDGRPPALLLELCQELDDFCLLEATKHFPNQFHTVRAAIVPNVIYLAYHFKHTRDHAQVLHDEIRNGLPAAIGRPWLYDYEIGVGDEPPSVMRDAIAESRAAVVAYCPDFREGKWASWELEMFDLRKKEFPGFKVIYVACEGQQKSGLGNDTETQVVGWEDVDRADQILRGLRGQALLPRPAASKK